jgi:hypothetical protein
LLRRDALPGAKQVDGDVGGTFEREVELDALPRGNRADGGEALVVTGEARRGRLEANRGEQRASTGGVGTTGERRHEPGGGREEKSPARREPRADRLCSTRHLQGSLRYTLREI